MSSSANKGVSRKKVDIFIGSLRGGGAERVCVTVANALAENNFDVRIVVINSFNSYYHNDLRKEVILTDLNKRNARSSFIKICRYLRDEKPENILVFNHQIAVILVLARKLMGLENRIIARNINTLSLNKEFETSIWHKYGVNFLTRLFYRKVDLIIAQSRGMAEDLVDNYRIDKGKIRVINNPVADFVYSSPVNGDEPKGKKEILFVGRLEHQKGPDILLEAFSLLAKREDDSLLRIVGDGTLQEKLKKQAVELNIADRVIFHGMEKDMGKVYRGAVFTVLTSRFEGFPNVLVESISMGVPVVAFDCKSGPDEIIVEGKNGFLVRYQEIGHLVECMQLALNKRWDKDEIKETARRFDSGVIIGKYIDIIEELSG